MDTIACKLWSAMREHDRQQSEMFDRLLAVGIVCEDFATDDYDGSLELLNAQHDELSTEQLTTLRAMGYDRVWLHGTSGERYYPLNDKQ